MIYSVQKASESFEIIYDTLWFSKGKDIRFYTDCGERKTMSNNTFRHAIFFNPSHVWTNL